jgi:hypothetical protein
MRASVPSLLFLFFLLCLCCLIPAAPAAAVPRADAIDALGFITLRGSKNYEGSESIPDICFVSGGVLDQSNEKVFLSEQTLLSVSTLLMTAQTPLRLFFVTSHVTRATKLRIITKLLKPTYDVKVNIFR